MRADRLVAILMLLQKNGRTTAQALAEELEVSERTIYRDIDALGMAGVPVYAQRGPGGGIALLESYRIDLTGLTTAELQALMVLSVPAPLFDLGIGSDLSSALRKVAAAVSPARREIGSGIQEKFFLDSSEWTRTIDSESIFEIVRKALWDEMQLSVSYFSEIGSHAGSISAVVRPYGLVAAAGKWSLVAGRDQHTITIPLANIHEAQLVAGRFNPPQDFDLESYWRAHAVLTYQQRPSLFVTAIVKKSVLPLVGDCLEGVHEADPGEGKTQVSLRFETFEQARTWILGYGNAIEVVEPLSLRLCIEDYARQILSVYEDT